MYCMYLEPVNTGSEIQNIRVGLFNPHPHRSTYKDPHKVQIDALFRKHIGTNSCRESRIQLPSTQKFFLCFHMPKALVVRHCRPVTFACEFTHERPRFPPITFSKTFPFKGKFLSAQLRKLRLKLKTCIAVVIVNFEATIFSG